MHLKKCSRTGKNGTKATVGSTEEPVAEGKFTSWESTLEER